MDGRVAPSPTAGPVPTPSPRRPLPVPRGTPGCRSCSRTIPPGRRRRSGSTVTTNRGSSGRTTTWRRTCYRGMEGAPGHQAAALTEDNSSRCRGSYWNPGAQTLGGFDQMTAIVGGLWGRPPRRGPPVLDRGFVRLAFPLRRTGESRERLLARRVPQDLGPRAPDLRRRPRRPSARPHVRGRPGTS